MTNHRIERFLIKEGLTLSPADRDRKTEESKTKRKFGNSIYYFHDTNGIQHYLYKNRDYRRKILRAKIAFDENGEYPSFKRMMNLKKIIRRHSNKYRILTEKSIKTKSMQELKYEILFTSNNNIKSYQYWINELAYNINENSTIQFEELSLDISVHPRFKKIIPHIETNQFKNKKIIPINDKLEELDNYELATIGKEYEKDIILPPYELAVKLKFDKDFFRKNNDFYKDSRSRFAKEFFEKIRNARYL